MQVGTQATQAQRVVQAIATILPEASGGRSPPRYLRQHEAHDLAAVCVSLKDDGLVLASCVYLGDLMCGA